MEKFYLKDHNAVAYEKIKARFEQDNMCAIVHATGTGKTYLGLKLAIDNPTKKVLFVVPRLNIKEHIQDTINNSKVQDDEIYDVENLDEEIENIEEIESEGTAEDIKAMAKRMGVSIKNVKFITYQALIRRDLKQLKEIDADYIIFDEMHHLGAEHWGKAGKDLVLTHPQAKVLGMSAFDVWSPGNNFAGYKIATTQAEQEALNGTSDENTPFFKGAVVSKIDLADAIMQGILPEPNYYLGLELFEELKELRDLRVSGKIDNKTAKEIDLMIGTYEELAEESENCSNVSIYSTNITANIYDGYTPRIFNSQALRFLESKVNKDTSAIYFSKKGFVPGTDKRYLDSAEEFCRDNLNIPFVSFKTTADDKDGELMRKAFAKGKDVKGDDIALDAKIMFAIDQYGEGTHIQNVNMVILDKKTLSPIVWGENIGRALHSIEGAENPTILDLAGNVDMVLSVIDKLKANGYILSQKESLSRGRDSGG